MLLQFLLPIITIIFWICFAILLIIFYILPLEFVKFKGKDNIIAYGSILITIIYAVASSFYIIIYSSIDFLINFDFLIALGILGSFIYLSRHFSKFISKKELAMMFFTPLIISFIVFYYIFNGDKIYKLSPYCKVTDNPKIVFCEYGNGSYIGEMKSFRRHGQGMYIWYSGKIYKGAWKNNLMDGEGEITDNGNTVRGIWKKHKLVK